VPVSASVGMARPSEPGCTPDELLRAADAAMYRVKRSRGGFWTDPRAA